MGQETTLILILKPLPGPLDGKDGVLSELTSPPLPGDL